MWEHATEYRIPEIFYFLAGLLRRKNGRSNFEKRFGTFLASFPADFAYGKLPEKVANNDHVTTGHCSHCKGKPVAKNQIAIS